MMIQKVESKGKRKDETRVVRLLRWSQICPAVTLIESSIGAALPATLSVVGEVQTEFDQGPDRQVLV